MTTYTTEDRKNAMSKQQWEIAFEDWKALLSTANATLLLKDPAACFDEGYRQAAMVAIALISCNSESSARDIAQLVERKLLK